ncbi:MAG: DUF1116 domain-containing protein, partial [Chloroflexota bacterium]
MARAEEVVPGLETRMLLHAGPPLEWDSASGPVRGALVGATVLESWADSLEEAEALLAGGVIRLSPCHHHQAVGPMAGVISPSMPVCIVENETYGNRAYATLNEGLGRVLRYGANDASVRAKLRWLADEASPILATALHRSGPVDLTGIMARALHMGDELHNRNTAATSLFTRIVAPHLPGVRGDLSGFLRYLSETDHFFLNLSMAACKASLDPARDVPSSTLVTAIARNGTSVGIQVSGLGEQWFTAPAPKVRGLYFPGYGEEDANPDVGDSAITETGGLGGFALAASPAITQFIGGDVGQGKQYTDEMYGITLGMHPRYTIPALNFKGTPVGVDVMRVSHSRIAPILDTGIAHREAGVGQIGAGIVRLPLEPFDEALLAYWT